MSSSGGSGGGGGGTVGVQDAACSTEVSCIVLSGEEEDDTWLGHREMQCESDGFGRIDRPGTWHDSSECPAAEYFAACIAEEREEYIVLADFNETLEAQQQRCESGGGVWEWYDEVEPVAYQSVTDATELSVAPELHAEILTTMTPHQLCSSGDHDGLVGITEYYNDATGMARYSHFVCAGGGSIQAPDHFTQVLRERYTLASEVPGASLYIGILQGRDRYYVFTSSGPNRHCWGCGSTFSHSVPSTSQGTATELIVTDTAGHEFSFELTLVGAPEL
jgi:hypothetical protein